MTELPLTALPSAAARAIRRNGRGDLHLDDVWRAAYACDGSNYMILPMGVYIPRAADDIAMVVSVANEHGFPVILRGGGSGLAGESLGRALIVDVSRHLNRIQDLDPSSRTVRLDAGVVLDRLNEYLAPHKLKFGPDPSSSSRAVLGALVANNSAGAHSPVYGHTRNHLRALEAVLADGSPVRFAPRSLKDLPPRNGSLESAVYRGAIHVIRENATLIEQMRPKTVRDRAGYLLYGVLENETVNLAKLLCPSEGTLAAITALELGVSPIPPATGFVVLSFPSAVAAAWAVPRILEHEPSAVELLDNTALHCIRLAGKSDLLPPDALALLFVEFYGESRSEISDRVERLIKAIRREGDSRFDLTVPRDAAHAAELWNVRKAVEPMQHRDGWADGTTPAGFIEDAAVHPFRLGEYIEGLSRILTGRKRKWGTYGHAAAGVLHTRVYLDLSRDDELDEMQAIATEVTELVLSLGGTISGEHGTGLVRTQFVPRQYGHLYLALQKIKRLFDPKNILNPGKIVGNDDPELMKKNMRARPPSRPQRPAPAAAGAPLRPFSFGSVRVGPCPSVPPLLRWREDGAQSSTEKHGPTPTRTDFIEWWHAAWHCTGCGECRTFSRAGRMCPSFKDSPDETRTTRARANLMRMIARGDVPPAAMFTPEFRDLADYCLNCKMCLVFCPVSADGGKLMAEARAQRAARLGRSNLSRLIVGAEKLGNLVCGRLAPLANFAASLAPARWLIQAMTGFDRRRPLPRFTRRTLLRRLADRRDSSGLTAIDPPASAPRSSLEIVYYIDQFANQHDPSVAEAFLAVMGACGVRVLIPPQQGAGMPALDYGWLDAGRQIIARNVRSLAPFARRGLPIVCTEPTAALALSKEYPDYAADEDLEDARAVASAAREATDFLRNLQRADQLKLTFKPLPPRRLGYHTPCHLQQFQFGRPGLELIRQIPGLTVELIDKGCCGLAGAFGWSREQFDLSQAIARPIAEALRASDCEAGATECSLCKMQLQAASGLTFQHPIQLLAGACDKG